MGGVPKGDVSADYYGVYCDRLERLLGGNEQDPPIVALMAWLAFGETPTLDAWLGAAVIVASTAYIAHREAVAARRARLAR